MVTLAALGIVALFAGLGYRRGAVQIAGLLFGLCISGLLCVPLGRGFESVTRVTLGTTGLLNRLISITIVGSAIMILVAIGFRKLTPLLLKRFAKESDRWRRHDKLAGLAIGGIEGILICLALMWAPLALEPVAQARLASRHEQGNFVPDPAASRIVALADAIRSSALGRIAKATNPAANSDLLALATDFSRISRDRGAMEFFMATPVMKRIRELPSVQQAIAALDKDPKISSEFSENGISTDGLLHIVESDTLLNVLDSTPIAADLTPLVNDLKTAIAQAKARITPPAISPPRK